MSAEAELFDLLDGAGGQLGGHRDGRNAMSTLVLHSGFVGTVPFAALPTTDVPAGPGVYIVTRPATTDPVFLPMSPAGWFKGKDPSLPISELEEAWVPGESVVYIGKATNLWRRLSEYRRHGEGKPVGHWGGRMIWQLADSAELLVAWREVEDPRRVEKAMIADFETSCGKRPFANRTG
jgi:hypothetical protein